MAPDSSCERISHLLGLIVESALLIQGLVHVLEHFPHIASQAKHLHRADAVVSTPSWQPEDNRSPRLTRKAYSNLSSCSRFSDLTHIAKEA